MVLDARFVVDVLQYRAMRSRHARTRAMAAAVGVPRALVGMIHVGALPGTPSAALAVEQLVERAVAEARLYRDAGYHALIVENMHDRPYLKSAVGPEVVAAMTAVAGEVRRTVGLPLGVQVL